MPAAQQPGEWTPHERTLVAWPARLPLWGPVLGRAEQAYTDTILAIASVEPVTVVADTGAAGAVRDRLDLVADGGAAPAGHTIDVVEEPIDDSWIRDTGPIVVRDATGARHGVDFRFNAWGEKFHPFGADAALAARLCARLGLAHVDAPLVLEGGAITVDGAGTLVTTEQCLLNPNRNAGRSRLDVERVLREHLGVERIVWLAAGLVEDRDTDGHVDNVCTFVAPGVALVQGTTDTANPNAELLADARIRLDAAGIEAVPVDVLPYETVADRHVVVPPLNLYQCNGSAATSGTLVVPVADNDAHAAAATVERLHEVLPERDIVTVRASGLAYGGGGVHCITQQVPA